MDDAVGTGVRAHHLAVVIDAKDLGFQGPGKIDGAEDTVLEQEPVGEAPGGRPRGIDIRADHLATVVDVEEGGLHSALDLECSVVPFVQQESAPYRQIGRERGAEVDDLSPSARLGRRWCRRRLSPRWLCAGQGECREKHNSGNDGRPARCRAPVLSAKRILISFWIDLSQNEAAKCHLFFYYEPRGRIGLVWDQICERDLLSRTLQFLE
jgi:hypothetical protein